MFDGVSLGDSLGDLLGFVLGRLLGSPLGVELGSDDTTIGMRFGGRVAEFNVGLGVGTYV